MEDQFYSKELQEKDRLSDANHLVVSLVQLLENAKFGSERDRQEAENSIAKVSAIFAGASSISPKHSVGPSQAGGLAPWQVLRLQGFIDGRIDQYMSVSELSQVVRLSSSHFARAFKRTFRETPHNYVLRRRVAHAKTLLNSTMTPLQVIALDCGFSDQAHLCKIFKRFVGETPASWRRYRQKGTSHGYGICVADIL